jgi:predicted nucleic acid-binding protein
MWRVVLDHAVLTSALLNPHGPAARLVDYALQGRVRLFATPRVVAATSKLLRTDVLRRRHGMSDKELSLFLADLPVLLCLVPTDKAQRAARSVEQDLLTCAAQSRADFLVTSTPLESSASTQSGTQIMKADQLVRLVGRGL